MAVPKSNETPRGVYLRTIVAATEPKDLFRWPKPTDDDLALFSRIITLYSAIDFMLHFVAAIMEDSGMLQPPFVGKTAKQPINRVVKAIRSCDVWNDSHNIAFDQIDEQRRVRNLVAHFVVRRFPAEDAFVFMTKSSYDFEQVYGVLPDVESMLFGVTDAAQLRGIISVIEGLLKWASTLPESINNPIEPGSKPS